MPIFKPAFILILFGILFTNSGLQAQQRNAVAVKGGALWSSLIVEDRDDGYEIGWLSGFTGGVSYRFAAADWFSLQPELLYTRKGATVQYREGGGERVLETLQLHYLEMPLLFVFTVPTHGALRGDLYLGAYGAARLDYDYEVAVNGTLHPGPYDDGPNDENLAPLDAGAILGATLRVGVGASELVLDVRASAGFVPLVNDNSDFVGNKSVMATVGIAL